MSVVTTRRLHLAEDSQEGRDPGGCLLAKLPLSGTSASTTTNRHLYGAVRSNPTVCTVKPYSGSPPEQSGAIPAPRRQRVIRGKPGKTPGVWSELGEPGERFPQRLTCRSSEEGVRVGTAPEVCLTFVRAHQTSGARTKRQAQRDCGLDRRVWVRNVRALT